MINIFTGQTIQNDAVKLLNSFGEPIRMQYYTRANAAGSSTYDDDVTFTKSGVDIWTNGMIFPIDNAKKGSFEAQLLENGKLQADDMLLYVPGTIGLSGAAIKIGFGSPVDEVRFVIWPGADNYQAVSYINAFNKVWTRTLTTGSFIGEN